MLTFRDFNECFKLDGDLLETMTGFDFDVSHSKPQHQKLIYEFGKKMKIDIHKERKSNRDKSMILLKPPAFIASGISTIFLSSDPNEFCDRWRILLQGKKLWVNLI